MTRSNLLAAVAAALIAVPSLVCGQTAAGKAADAASKPAASAQPRKLDLQIRPHVDDFDQMLERRVIRVNVPYSRTLYFVDKGTERGISAGMVRDFERWLNKKYAKQVGKRPLTAFVVVATRDKLFTNLREGYADVALGSLGVTEERLKQVDFIAPPDLAQAKEVVVTGPASPALASIDDLSGKRVHVRKSSTYYESLVALNARFKQQGKPPATLVLVPDALEDDDLMEMTNAGLLEVMVTADWAAKVWAPVLPKLRVHSDIVLNEGVPIGWAIRKNSPKLAAEINEFYAGWIKKQRLLEVRLQQYAKRIKQIRNPTASKDYQRFEAIVALFEKYGGQYHFDALMLAAQGYQESQLNQSARSHVGAIGVMQVMPATGAELKVGDITLTEPNIHAGTKYMDQLMSRYFPDAEFDDQNRTLFAFASYNCGPGNVSKMRREAVKRGLDPDVWFNNVEVVTAEKIGAETTTYARNIFKYYTAYKLEYEARAEREKLKQQAAPAKS